MRKIPYSKYRLYRKFVMTYLKLNGLKVKPMEDINVDSEKPIYYCSCGEELQVVQNTLTFPFNQTVLTFYLAFCEKDQVGYLHKAIEVK